MFEGILGSLMGSGGVGSAVGAVGSGILSFMGGQATNEASAAQADTNRLWQQNMSNTAYQRAVGDMQAAGLNPMLAYSQGGATTPGGAVAPVQNALGNAVSSAQAGAQVAPAIRQLNAQTEKTGAETDLTRQQTVTQRSQAILNEASAAQAVANVPVLSGTAQRLGEDVKRLARENALDIGGYNVNARAGEAMKVNREAELKGQQLKGDMGFHEARRAAAEATLSQLGIPQARNEAAAQGSWWKRNVSPYLPDLGSSASSAARLFK